MSNALGALAWVWVLMEKDTFGSKRLLIQWQVRRWFGDVKRVIKVIRDVLSLLYVILSVVDVIRWHKGLEVERPLFLSALPLLATINTSSVEEEATKMPAPSAPSLWYWVLALFVLLAFGFFLLYKVSRKPPGDPPPALLLHPA